MTRRQCCNDEERAWLDLCLAEFEKAKEAKMTTAFFADKLPKFLKEFPPMPSEKDVEQAQGDMEKAKFLANRTRGEQIRNWFNNHARPSTSGTGSRQTLKIAASSKLVQPWQAYQNLFWETELKDKVMKEWNLCLKSVPEGTKPPQKFFAFTNDKMQAWYEAADDDVKAQVEDHRRAMKERSAVPSGEAETIQQAIDKLPRTLQIAAESLAKQTGWHVTIIAGGPSPRMGGEVKSLAIHHGTSADGQDFEKFLGDQYMSMLVDPFLNFLVASFGNKRPTGASDTGGRETQSNAEPLPPRERSEYEKQREANIARNNIILEGLGLIQNNPDKSVVEPGRKKKEKKEKEKSETPRRSSRLQHTEGNAETNILGTDPTAQQPTNEKGEIDLDDSPGKTDPKVDGAPVEEESPPPASPRQREASRARDGAEPSQDSRNLSTSPDEGAGPDLGQVDKDVRPTEESPHTPPQSGTEKDKEGKTTESGAKDVDTPMQDLSEIDEGKWYHPWLIYFRGVSDNPGWRDLVSKWTRFESMEPKEGRLPARDRPEAVQWWMRRHKKMTSMPPIQNTKEYSSTWQAWWSSLQPAWRGGLELLREIPEDANWTPLLEGGPLGTGLVVMTLAWWVKAATSGTEVDPELAGAIADVSWVLDQLPTALTAAINNPPTPTADTTRNLKRRGSPLAVAKKRKVK